MSTKVKLFVTTYCSYCNMAKRFLGANGIEFETIDVTTDAEKRDWLVKTTGMRTVPQIFVGDTSVGGYSELTGMHRKGKLQPLLEENDVPHTLS